MSGFGNLRRYLRVARSDARITRDVDDELATHIDLRAEALERSGMTAAEARARAVREFGDLDDAKRYCAEVDRRSERRHRRLSWFSELRQDAAYAVRMLRRAPAFAAATVITLAFGVGASTAVYGVLDTYLFRRLPFPNADRLVSIVSAPTVNSRGGPSLDNVDWSKVDSVFEQTIAWDVDGFTIRGEQHAENVTGAWITAGYFRALGVRLAVGRAFAADEYRENAPVAIISHELWLRQFGGDSTVVGKKFLMHSTESPNAPLTTIVGVLPKGFWSIEWRDSHVLRPMRPGNWMPSLALLKPGVSRLEAQSRLTATVKTQLTGTIDPQWHMTLVPPLDLHSMRVRNLLLAVFGAALFMFLAACGSVAGTLVSRTAARRGELAVRLALGGSRARVIRQLLTESAVLSLLAGVLGLGIAFVLLRVGGALVERQLGTGVPGGAGALEPTWSLMALSVGASALAGIMVGLIPALTFLRSSRLPAVSASLGSSRGTAMRSSGTRIRRVLIAAQVTMATVLLFGAGLMFRTINRMSAIELGFRTDGVVAGSVLLPPSRYPDSASKRMLMDRVLARIESTPGVRSAATVYPRPFTGSFGLPVELEGTVADEATAPRTAQYTVSPGYFETMDIRLRTGRTFRESDDHASPLVVVVSEALARRLSPNGDVIGRRIRLRVPYLASWNDVDTRPWRTIVGVVTDTEKGFGATTSPDVYVPYAQNPRSYQSIVVRTTRQEETIYETLKRAAAAVDPDLALTGVESMTDAIADRGAQRRGLTVLLGAFAVFSVALSALALYASLSYTVVQRRSELALRMAVGASTRSILGVVVGEGLATTAVGVVVGIAGSIALGRVLQNQVYRIGTNDPTTLIAISVVLTVAAALACAVPGLRAARTDPALALRE